MLLALLTVWFLASFGLVYEFTHRRLAADLKRRSVELEQPAGAVASQFERSIAFLYGLPATLADDPGVITCLAQHALGQTVGEPKSGSNHVKAHAQRNLDQFNRHLGTVCRELRVDIVWVVTSTGACVATAISIGPNRFSV